MNKTINYIFGRLGEAEVSLKQMQRIVNGSIRAHNRLVIIAAIEAALILYLADRVKGLDTRVSALAKGIVELSDKVPKDEPGKKPEDTDETKG